ATTSNRFFEVSVPELPGWVFGGLVCPFVAAFVVDLTFCEEPLAVDLDKFVLIVAESIEDAAAVRVVVGVVEPVGAAFGFGSVDFDNDVRDIVARGTVVLPRNRFGLRHPSDYCFDRLPAFDFATAVIEYTVLGKRRDIKIGIMEVERKEVSRL